MSDRPAASEATASLEPDLNLRRQAAQGFGVGGIVTAVVFVFFVLIPGTTRPAGLYVGLAFVLWISFGLLVTAVLVGWRLHRGPTEA